MVITLCGSNRFEAWFHIWNELLSLSGHTVFSLSVYASQKEGNNKWYSEDEKVMLDKVHKEKIRLSEAVFVINPFAYIGESTLSEVEYASRIGRKLYFLESWGRGKGVQQGFHIQNYVDAAARFGVVDFGSPIDTWPSMSRGEPYALLPAAGPYRNALVEKLNAFEAKMKFAGVAA